jgi:8-oxo-dGTP pyrophosphatase MutT (NUDIX family)
MTPDVRGRVRKEVASIEPLDATEAAHVADALAWIDSGAELCRIAKPAVPPKHLVSYFVLVDGPAVLLVDHRSARLWLPTGGHVEPEEDPRETVIRELAEELGIAIATEVGPPLMITVTTTVGLTAGHTDVSLWYVIEGDRRREIAFDRTEFEDARWFAFPEVPLDRSEPHLARFLRKLERSRERALARAGTVVVEPLAAHPEVLPVLEEWFRTEWPEHYAEGGRGDARRDLAAFASRDALPIGVVAFEGDRLCGVAALKADSIASHGHLSPWAAAGLVAPADRGRGIGRQLLAALEQEARRLGYGRLYCGTSTAASLLLRSGWRLLERIDHEGQSLGIYCKEL